MTRVSPGGPAEQACLREGDKILQVCSESHPQGGTVCSQETVQTDLMTK